MKIKYGTFANSPWCKVLIAVILTLSLFVNILQHKALNDQREINKQIALDNADLFMMVDTLSNSK